MTCRAEQTEASTAPELDLGGKVLVGTGEPAARPSHVDRIRVEGRRRGDRQSQAGRWLYPGRVERGRRCRDAPGGTASSYPSSATVEVDSGMTFRPG